MTEDFYCDEVLSGKTQVNKVFETENVLAYYHSSTESHYEVVSELLNKGIEYMLINHWQLLSQKQKN